MNTHPLILRLSVIMVLATLACATPFAVQRQPDRLAPPTPSGAPTLARGRVTDFSQVHRATIMIEAKGSFATPFGGESGNVIGQGSGFIISPAGLALTNWHVVGGAGSLKVWLDGEREPRPARVLGASECSDLAVLDIEGDGFDYLGWRTAPPAPGLTVYAAGFPLGDPQFTLTQGIVSKTRADGKTYWASVEAVLEHDATLNPGNSGGPLVDTQGQVVGINYAGRKDTSQYFAIAAHDLLALIRQLQAGQHVNFLGLNGEAVGLDLWLGAGGIFVNSVAAGSRADLAGVQAGDLITRLGGLDLAEDDSLGTYCDVLRSHGPDDVIAIEVVRGEATLVGQIGGRPLVDEAAPPAASLGPTPVPEPTAEGERVITDDSGVIQAIVPASWEDVESAPWLDDDQAIGQSLTAAPDLLNWEFNWDAPGMFVGVSTAWAETKEPADLLIEVPASACTSAGRSDYADARLAGVVEHYTDCGGPGGPAFFQLAARSTTAAPAYLVYVQFAPAPAMPADAFETFMANLILTP